MANCQRGFLYLVCGILSEHLGIPPKAVYVTYHPVSDWGWNGRNF